MDKYEFNIKVEQMKKQVGKGDFETAMKIADAIDWRRVRNTNLLSMVAQIYEKNEEYAEAKEILLLAFERAPIGKRLLYKLTEIALKENNVSEAEAYYREFCDLAPDDSRQNLLRYMILKAKGAPAAQLIRSLEEYVNQELDEKWMYELARLYHEAGMPEDCVRICDKIMLMFGLGKYVDKAMDLKVQYAPLSQYQMDLVENREKYEAKLRDVERGDFPADELADTEEYGRVPVRKAAVDEELVADLHEAEVEEKLAQEMSRMAQDEVEIREVPAEQTRVLDSIRDIIVSDDVAEAELEKPTILEEPITVGEAMERKEEEEVSAAAESEKAAAAESGKQTSGSEKTQEKNSAAAEQETSEEEEPVGKPVNHLMIEARTPQKGLEMAIQALKQIHRELGTKPSAVKITGEKLNKKGIFASAEKLAGKDLIIEDAGDLSEAMLGELNHFMDQDDAGTIVVLIDNPRQMEELHRQNPALAARFECIGSGEEKKEEFSDVEQAVRRQVVKEEKAAERAAKQEIRQQKKETKQAEKTSMMKPAPVKTAPAGPDMKEELSIDDFAQYACQYAADIDCSITGKSMLALYERIEIMEEDGIPLNREEAENLIEEAADKAEKPSFGKRIKGLFSSKYDKNGLLILKEEHFID